MTTAAAKATENRERRAVQGLEFRAAAEGTKDSIGTIVGYAAVFNSKSLDLGGFREFIRPGAFAESLKRGDDVIAVGWHDQRVLVGRRSANTLSLAEDDKGLKVEIKVPDTQAGRDMVTSVKRGDLAGMSFGFATVEDKWTRDNANGGSLVRELIQVDLYDVGPVTWPAYPDTSAEARSLGSVLEAGRRRLGTEAHARRDRIIRAHKARVAAWVH